MNHPLFPNADESDKREIAYINIVRYGSTGAVWHPRAFAADELTGLDDITGMFGGGSYELIAREAGKKNGGVGPICDRVRVNLPGESRPFIEASETAAPPASAPVTMPMGSSDPQVAMFMAIMQMQQAAAAESTKLMLGMFEATSQQTAAIITAMAGNKNDGGGAAVIEAMSRMSQSHTEALTKLMENRSSGGGNGGGDAPNPMDALMHGLELGQAMGEKSAQEPSDLAIVMQGVTAAIASGPKSDTPAITAKNGAH